MYVTTRWMTRRHGQKNLVTTETVGERGNVHTPVQVSSYEHGYTRPFLRLVFRSIENHGRAVLALRIADIVQMRVDQRDVTGVPVPVMVYRSEEGEGGKTRTTGAVVPRAGLERLVGEPKGVGFEEGKCGASVCVLLLGDGLGWTASLTDGRRSDRTRLLRCHHPYPRQPAAPVQ